MYRIIKEGNTLATVSALSWIKKQENGYFVLCEENVAHGIVLDGIIYHVAGKTEIDSAETVVITEVSEAVYNAEQDNGIALNALLSNTLFGANNVEMAAQFRKALQMFTNTLSEEKAMEIAGVYDTFDPNTHSYAIGEYCVYGKNSVGDPQLYVCLQAHNSQTDWTPDTAVSLWKAVGITSSGYPEWSQPVGSTDAYKKGDIISFNGTLYRSLIDANVWSPTAYAAGWEEVTI